MHPVSDMGLFALSRCEASDHLRECLSASQNSSCTEISSQNTLFDLSPQIGQDNTLHQQLSITSVFQTPTKSMFELSSGDSLPRPRHLRSFILVHRWHLCRGGQGRLFMVQPIYCIEHFETSITSFGTAREHFLYSALCCDQAYVSMLSREPLLLARPTQLPSIDCQNRTSNVA